ncbi:MAG: NUDIX domain-containing protein [Acetobacteraceae bacterium]
MIRAAGILLLWRSPTGDQALFLKRGPGSDHPGEWAFPGGQIEGDETPIEAARRELAEEIGEVTYSEPIEFARRIAAREVAGAVGQAINPPLPPGDAIVVPGELVDYTTFVARVAEQFIPTLCDEHTGYAWASIAEPPEPLHPGARVALAKLTADELGIARMIAAGDLTSPQTFANVTLFAMRITGTGTAYRKQLDEYVYRPPENYLADEFLARCNGLPVIWLHPDGSKLNSQEFGRRIIGTVVLPYIVGDEVWGIAKVYDDTAIEALSNEQWSTSPAVVFRETDGNTKIELETGATLLIEGKPSLLDHLAICQQGVWDKGGAPAGVSSSTIGGSVMTEEEMKAKADAEAAEKTKAEEEAKKEAKEKARQDSATFTPDKLLAAIGDVCARMDSLEKRFDSTRRRDADDMPSAEQIAADKARKDAEEKEASEKAKADAEEKARADSAAAIQSAIERGVAEALAKARLPMTSNDATYADMASIQARADAVLGHFGNRAPPPLQGETGKAYRIRMLEPLQVHCTPWKGIKLADLPDAALGIAETAIYADAMVAARSPDGAEAGTLREIRTTDATGRQISTFVGEPITWMGQFRTTPRALARPMFRQPARTSA